MREIGDILKISKSIKLLVKIKNVSFTLRKKNMNFLAKPVVAFERSGIWEISSNWKYQLRNYLMIIDI